MTNSKYGVVVAKITVALEQLGAMSCAEISKAIGIDGDNIRSVLSRMRKNKKIYVSGWTKFANDERVYPRKLYDLGDYRDVKYIPTDTKDTRRKYDVANAKQAVSSVFDLAMNREQRTEKLKKLSIRVNASR